MITFEEQVDVERTVAAGSTDQLTCDLLAIMLARQESGAAGTPGKSQGKAR